MTDPRQVAERTVSSVDWQNEQMNASRLQDGVSNRGIPPARVQIPEKATLNRTVGAGALKERAVNGLHGVIRKHVFVGKNQGRRGAQEIEKRKGNDRERDPAEPTSAGIPLRALLFSILSHAFVTVTPSRLSGNIGG